MKTAAPPRPNPFPGLRPFRSDEHHLFFGREEQTAALLQLLRTNRFLAVVGTSGSGKSSLVRAGMIAELHGGTMTHAGSTWEVMILRPGGSPIENLARAFVDAGLYDPDDPSTLPRLLATLNRSRFGLVEAMKQSDVFAPGTNLLVVVDQFEELFRFRQQGVDSEEAAAAFVNLLLTAGGQAECPIYVTITMRSDYLGDCSEIPGLAEAVNDGEYLIPRLQRDQKRDAIEKPVGVGGARIAPLLVQRLLNEVGDDPDQLPVLQHALMRMWEVWSAGSDHHRPIGFRDFEATGGLGAALSNHADEIYAALPDDSHRAACEKIFKTLTEKGADNRGIRRPTRLARLQAIAEADRATVTAVLDAFRGPGVTFLMPGTDVELGDRTVVDLSHESLMRGWQRLRGWVEEEAQSARVFRRLLDTARLWNDGKAGLFRDPDLQIALSWREQEAPNAEWAEQYGGRFATAIAFLEASNADAEAERQAKEAARQRELAQAQELAESRKQRLVQQQRAARRLRKLIAGLGVVAVIAGLACIAALIANKRAIELAEHARQNAERAEQSQHETEKALAFVETEKAKAESAERLARAAEEAGRKLLYTTDMRLAPFVWRDDRSTAEQLRVLLAKHTPDGTGAAGKDADARPDLRGFEWYYHQHLLQHSAAVFAGSGVPISDSAFTANGELVTLDQSGQLRRWDLGSQEEDRASRRELPGGTNARLRVLSPGGRLAALAEGNRVVVFDAATGAQKFQIDSLNYFSRRLIFSQDESKLIVVDNKIRWCDTASGAVIASVDQFFNRLESLAASADGLTLAAVGLGDVGTTFSTYRLDPATRAVTPLATNVNGGETLLPSAMSPDGRRLAVGWGLYGVVSVFDTATGRRVAHHGTAHGSPVSAMAFAADGATLATADAEGTIKIWADAHQLTSKSTALRTLKGHQGRITTVRFSADGKRLVSGSIDTTARVWELDQAGAANRPLERSGGDCYVARFSSDGQLIAAADGGSVRLWDAATGRLVRELPAGDATRVFSVAFSPTDRNLLAVGRGGLANVSYVSLWDIHAGAEIARLPGATDLPGFFVNENNGAVGALAFSPDGKYLVAGFGSKFLLVPAGLRTPLKVWEVATRRPIRRLYGHLGYCVCLDFSRDGTRLASGGRDGMAIVWSTKTWEPTQRLQNPDPETLFRQPGRGAMVEDVAFSPDGKTLAVASYAGNLHLWDVASGKVLAPLQGHSGAVTAAAFSPDGRTLASGSVDQTVRLWNVLTRRELLRLDPAGVEMGPLRTLTFSPDGNQLLAGGEGLAGGQGNTTGFWSAVPVVWSDPSRAAEALRQLLQSNADFQGHIRLLSENLRLYAALEKLDAKDVRVRAALAATRANWHASRRAWAAATADFDRLAAADPAKPEAWLRTPGLIRVATALLHQDRPAVAARLLQGGAKRRALDGLPAVVDQVGTGFAYLLFRERLVHDAATGELLHPLRAAVNERLAKAPRDPGLLELRAELAGQWSDAKAQLADYTAAIDALSNQKAAAAVADIQRLYGRRADAHAALGQWQPAVDDYARAITGVTADDALLSKQARVQAEVLASSKRWNVLKPIEAKSDLGSTLSILPDDSILASGANPRNDRYRVVLTVETDTKLAAVRLEALTHDSLPGKGPGRTSVGGFAQTAWTVTAASRDRKKTTRLQFDNAWADHEMPGHPISTSGHWNISLNGEGQNGTAVWSMATPISLKAGATLTFEMQFKEWNDNRENLGHFRLSVSSDPAAIQREREYLAFAVADPWQKLAAAYLLNGDRRAVDRLVERRPQLAGRIGDLFTQEPLKDWQRALDIYNKGITPGTTDGDLLAKRARANEALQKWDAAAADWSRAAAGNPEAAKLFADFARRLAAGGQASLAEGPFEKARALYEQALAADPRNDVAAADLAQLLLDKEASSGWTVLTPTEMQSEGGATLSLKEDGSILAGGPNPAQDTYTVVCPATLPNIVAVRLEALPDPSLPVNGPGRANGNGNMALSEWKVTAEPRKPGEAPRAIRWRNAWSDHAVEAAMHYRRRAMHIGLAIDGDSDTYWETWPRAGFPHGAVFLPEEPIRLEGGGKLKFVLEFRSGSVNHSLGRFRLSVSADAAALDRERKRFAAMKPADPWLRLGGAYALIGRNDKALNYLTAALARADGYEARNAIISLAAPFDDLLAALSQRQSHDPQFQLALARNLWERGKQRLTDKQPAKAQADLEQARDVYTRLRTKHPQPGWAVLTPTELQSQGGETLTVESDGSIFVSGPNPERAVYALKLRSELPTLNAIRLETLPDARLPQGGAGRYGNGNFHLAELTAAVVSGGPDAKPIPISFASATADEQQIQIGFGPATLLDGNPRTYWDTYPRMQQPHSVILGLKTPLQTDGSYLSITLDSGISPWGQHGLGRFRLSATNAADPTRAASGNDVVESEGVELRVALATAHAQQGHDNEAVAALVEALNLTADRAGKAKIIAEAAPLEGVLEKLAERAAGDARLQAELAQHFAERGNAPLADAARAKARALFEEKLAKEPENSLVAAELADLLLLDTTAWAVLKPVELKSQSGVVLTAQEDRSVLVSGKYAAKDVYSVDLGGCPKEIRAIRLEAMRDDRLPGGGPGTSAGGFFVLSEFKAFRAGEKPAAEWRPISLRSAIATFEERPAQHSLEPGPSGWSIAGGGEGRSHSAYFAVGRAAKVPASDRLRVLLEFSHQPGGGQPATLGRFRLSVSADADAYDREKRRLAAIKLTDAWAKLAAAYHLHGDQPALDGLLKRHPEAAAGPGDLYAAAQDWERAVAEYRRQLTGRPADRATVTKFARACQSAGRTREAVPFLARLSAAEPKDMLLAMHVAALQAWFGQDPDLAATRRQILASAGGTRDVFTAERAAKACSIVPSADRAEREAALALGRTAVKLDKDGVWNLLALGMAEYRCGNHAAAAAALRAAEKPIPNIPPVVSGIAAFYRAMSLSRQGQPDAARKLATAAAATMKPLPKDEQNPLADGASWDDLILWLAYKEAKAMIRFEAPPPAGKSTQK